MSHRCAGGKYVGENVAVTEERSNSDGQNF
jgi:hypothetical protein